MKIQRASALAVCAALLWGTAPAVGKSMLVYLTHMQLMFYLAGIAAVTLLVVVIVQGKLRLLSAYQLRDYLRFAGMGFLGVFLYGALLYAGIEYAPAQEAFIVNYTWPLWVVVFAALVLGEKITRRKIIALLVGFIGVYIVATNGNIQTMSFAHLKGDLLALCGAVAYGLFSVLSKRHNDERVTATMLYYGFAFVYIAAFCALTHSLPTIHVAHIAPGLIWMGAASSALGFVCWLTALKQGDIAKLSNIILLTPFLSFVYIFLLTGERIKLSSFVGCALIVAGILYQRTSPQSREVQKLNTVGEL